MFIIGQSVDSGNAANRANSSTSLCAKVRKTAPLTMRPSTAPVFDRLATTELNLLEGRKMTSPQARDSDFEGNACSGRDLEKSMAQICPRNGCVECAAFLLHSRSTFQDLLDVGSRSFSMLKRCFI